MTFTDFEKKNPILFTTDGKNLIFLLQDFSPMGFVPCINGMNATHWWCLWWWPAKIYLWPSLTLKNTIDFHNLGKILTFSSRLLVNFLNLKKRQKKHSRLTAVILNSFSLTHKSCDFKEGECGFRWIVSVGGPAPSSSPHRSWGEVCFSARRQLDNVQ